MLGWISNIFIILSIYYTGKKRKIGWLFSIIGNIGWSLYAIQIQLWSALFIDLVCLALAIWNWRKWNGTCTTPK
jgi:nicotinamide riboside transporter PnuC